MVLDSLTKQFLTSKTKKLEKFRILIDAESPDGVAVKCETESNVHCSKATAVSVLVNFIKNTPEIENLLEEALAMYKTDKDVTEPISIDDYLDSINAANN